MGPGGITGSRTVKNIAEDVPAGISLPDSCTFTLTALDGTATYTGPMLGDSLQGLVSGAGSPVSALNYIAALPKWRKALGGALAGQAAARILFAGDSTTAGMNSSGATRALSPAHLAGRLLSSAGVPVNTMIGFGDATKAGGSTFTTFDARWTVPAAWATPSNVATVGGFALLNSTDTSTLAFAPGTGSSNQFDSFEIFYVINTGYGTFTVNVDGGATLATINSAGTRALGRQIVPCTLGNHAINIARNGTGGAVIIIGIVPRNSAAPSVEIYNGGIGGATLADLSQSGGQFLYGDVAASIAPHLTVCDIGINDRRTTTYAASWATSLQALLTTYQATGDVVACLPVPSALSYSAFTTQANQDAYDAAISATAAALGIPVWSKRARLGTYEIANPQGLYSDTLHPSNAGYAAQALDLSRLLLG